MKILDKILNFIKKNPRKGAFYNSSEFELENFICGIGKSKFNDKIIIIDDYPFLPSFVNYKKQIEACDINAICYKSFPPLLKVKNELIFIAKDKHEELKMFAERNNIDIFKSSGNWDMILEPYLDTEFTEENNSRIYKRLNENGLTNSEIDKIREEVEEQMLKYNFDTMLWEWVNLGLSDVLAAMRVKYDKLKFQEFYFKAMEIELRV
ncbi:MAG: hypothetical protein ABI549_08230 [Flavobacterium sp.]|uniref:hypothetical protein n=1 Tax=Flavobacterium sp. TaxID=239 RepID=UPI0032642734